MRVHSVRQLVQVLGGPAEAGRLLGAIPQKVCNWRAANRIPSTFYNAHRHLLLRRRIYAPPELWGQARLNAAE